MARGKAGGAEGARYWTTREIERLRSMEGMSPLEVAIALNRTPKSVRAQATRQGVRLSRKHRMDRERRKVTREGVA